MTMLTEDEAKAKWCPLDRAERRRLYSNEGVGTGGGSALPLPLFTSPNRDNCRCIASACMAWRIGAPEKKGSRYLENINKPGGEYADYTTPARGFCGAFGTPTP